MKKIIHLSDLHIGYKKQDLTHRFEGIVQSIIFVKEPAEDYVIVVTGDLVEKATDPANHEMAKLYLDRLVAHGFTVLVVPGNHDYGTGVQGDRKYQQRFKSLFYDAADVSFPRLDVIDGIAFIGLDTMEEELNTFDKLGANGELGAEQRQRLDALLGQDDVLACRHRVIYMHHHPFDPWIFHELKDSKELGQILMRHGTIDAILFGHNHHFRKWNGKWGIPRCYDAGSSTRKNDSPSFHRVIDLSKPPTEDYDADFFYDIPIDQHRSK
ncbi:MAG: metallophosphoesterase [candidate division KSB1 bacterium]|nr:metallophosphoesterase [candidate division KSB1 bacterium]MDZ7336205.1 metallophosphoesterase [candidate division KSB1 bacterium]MDZ7358993.1 metallophosphoesterase [candidate division KSB1 bacterium]MDZ7402339.1 metallophosphoesterase [candidate division KSB1 bacterium]